MMQQSNALRRLEETLTEAINSGARNQASGPILLKAMKLSEHPQNVLDFYELLNSAEEEARSIRNKPNINRYLQTIEELHQVFVVNHVWEVPWDVFATYVEGKGVLNTLDALADFFNSQHPARFLDQDFLEKLNGEFKDLLDRILESDLSRELKSFLIERIENILKAISKYHIDGTEGLEKATKSLVSDLVMEEHSFKNEDKSNPVYESTKAWILSLLIYITPIVGAVPDIHDFWLPELEKIAEKVKQIVCETPNIQEAFEKASSVLGGQQQKSIEGRDLKALPASKKDLEAIKKDKSDP